MTAIASTNPKKRSDRCQTAQILGLATAQPPHSISQVDAALIAQALHITKRWHQALPALYRKTGVQYRGSVLLDSNSKSVSERQSFYTVASDSRPLGPTTSERMKVYAREAAPLLRSACESAIERSQVNPSSITHLLTVSCTGFSAPGSDLQLIEHLKLNKNVQRANIGFMGCHGAINAIRVAKSIVEADPNALVLLGAVELCSIHQQYTDDPQQLVANALFADGAAAMVIGSENTKLSNDFLSSELNASDWSIVSTFSQVLPDTTDLMSWNIGDHGFQMSLDPQVPACIESYLEDAITKWLKSQSLCIEEIDLWAIHPGGPRIVQASGAALGLTSDQIAPSLSVLANYGNMSSPTVLFILDQLSATNHINQNSGKSSYAILLAFGPGLCIEASLLKKG